MKGMSSPRRKRTPNQKAKAAKQQHDVVAEDTPVDDNELRAQPQVHKSGTRVFPNECKSSETIVESVFTDTSLGIHPLYVLTMGG